MPQHSTITKRGERRSIFISVYNRAAAAATRGKSIVIMKAKGIPSPFYEGRHFYPIPVPPPPPLPSLTTDKEREGASPPSTAAVENTIEYSSSSFSPSSLYSSLFYLYWTCRRRSVDSANVNGFPQAHSEMSLQKTQRWEPKRKWRELNISSLRHTVHIKVHLFAFASSFFSPKKISPRNFYDLPPFPLRLCPV